MHRPFQMEQDRDGQRMGPKLIIPLVPYGTDHCPSRMGFSQCHCMHRPFRMEQDGPVGDGQRTMPLEWYCLSRMGPLQH